MKSSKECGNFYCGIKDNVDSCPARGKQNRDLSNPDPRPKVTDPRPPVPEVNNCSYCCSPADLPKAPVCVGLKLRQLDDCYNCKLSEGCINRKKVFYDRWQHHLENLPRRMPNYDYRNYDCEKYKEKETDDYLKFTDYFAAERAPRTETEYQDNFRCFFTQQAIQDSQPECPIMEKVPPPFPDTGPMATFHFPTFLLTFLGRSEENAASLYQDEWNTFWYTQAMRPSPRGFITGLTPFKSRQHPFRKDTRFTTPTELQMFKNEQRIARIKSQNEPVIQFPQNFPPLKLSSLYY